MLTYGDGPSGSMALRTAMAGYVNREFNPRETVENIHVTILSGVGAVIDALCFSIAEPGDGILIARPLYVGFLGDMENRAGSVSLNSLPLSHPSPMRKKARP